MDTLVQDLRYTLRGLRRSPGFAIVAAATLALGIGVNTTIFSVVNAVLLRPHELIDVYRSGIGGASYQTSSYLDYLDLRQQATTLDGLIAYSNFVANLARESRSELILGEVVSDNYFEVLGIEPELGRDFTADEFEAELTHPVSILSHGFWETRFGRDPAILGQSIRLNGTAYTIVGIAPADFGGMFPAVTAQMWVPVTMIEELEPLGNQSSLPSPTGDTRLTRRGTRWLWMRGRLRDGVEIGQATAELSGITARLAEQYPETNERQSLTVLRTDEVRFNPDFDVYLAPAGALIVGVVGLVLLVACANIANMLLARASARRKEVAIRLAIGAGRARLVRQLLTESVLLALVGGSLGFLVAIWTTRLIAAIQPPLPIDLGVDFSVDVRVLGFTLLVSVVTGIAFGLMPALRASRPDLVPTLKDAAEGGRRRIELRDALVAVQVAVSMVLLVGGALMIRSLSIAKDSDVGFEIDRTSYVGTALDMVGYDEEAASAFFQTARARLLEQPGVEAVTITSRVPMSLNDNNWVVYIDGHQGSADDPPYIIGGAYVDNGYLETLGLRMIEGRWLEAADSIEARRVTVVSQAFADRFWPGESAVGKQFRTTTFDGPTTEIVGVVDDYKTRTVGEAPTPYLHFPFQMGRTTYGVFVVRTREPARSELARIERALLAIDPELVFLQTGPVRELVETTLFPVQLGAILIGAFATLAVLLAGVGLYGVIGYAVSRRTREIGIRIALGAESGGVLRLVVRQGMAMVLVGVGIGAVMAAFAARVLSSVLYGISPLDPVAYGAAIGALIGISLLANFVPARRAARVDPMIALRSE